LSLEFTTNSLIDLETIHVAVCTTHSVKVLVPLTAHFP